MPKDVKQDGEYFNFTGFLHMSPGDGVRYTKTNSGSYSHERKCKVNIRVPVTAFTVPDFTVDIDFKGSGVSDTHHADTIQDIGAALEHLPVIVRVLPASE